MYHAFALLQPDSNLTLPATASKLKAAFPNFDVEQSSAEIVLANDSWDYHLLLESGPDVLNESQSLARRIVGLDDDSPLGSCDRRLNMSSDTPDPFMEHFDDHFKVLEALRGFKGVILVDPNEPALL
jgi:hypothetical protein